MWDMRFHETAHHGRRRYGMEKKYRIPGVKVYDFARIEGLNNIQFGKNVIIDSYAFVYAHKPMKIGNNVHIASFVFLSGGDEIEIGDFVGIFQGCKVYASTDDFKGAGFGNPTIPENYRHAKRAPVKLGRFVVLGANSVVLPGVHIGEGATVGACSVVTRDLDPWGIYIGNRKVGKRDRDAVMRNYESYLREVEGIK
jgi:galactoside O-acetyltransferase